MRSAAARVAALLIAAGCAAAPVAARAGPAWNAGAGVSLVAADNVFGTESSPGDGIADGRGWLLWTPADALQLGASGRLVRFLDNPDLNHAYLQASAEARRSTPGAATQWMAGLSVSQRANDDLYALYDYREGGAYLSAKRYLAPGFSAQLRADLSRRTYPDSPDEDARRTWLSARLQRSLPTRTSLGCSARAGWKSYATDQLEPAASWEISAQVAQSLSSRFALRAWWSRARLYEYGDVAVQLAAFDNPLLDEFSADGPRAGAALKMILPRNCLAELSAERAWSDYPGRPPQIYDPATDEFLLDDDDQIVLGAGERSDELSRVRLDLEQRLAALHGGATASFRVSVEWARRSSNDLYWQWSGWSVQAGAAFEY
ncbi:MAG: hypothetical protein IPH09_12785 [bacterium]|nr:hypothetical protein [bacterium]